MVKKHDGSWRMCVDFKDLNKACLKDGYPLPEIYWKVESLCGFPFKGFLDAYKGYHQIKTAKEDEEKTTFITNQGIFCYSKMPFGLRNVGATYQRLVDKAFHKQVGRNLEVYVDDLVIKSRTKDEIIRDTEETFKTLREINIKLDLKMYLRGRRRDVHRIQIQYQRNKAKSAEKSLPFFKTLKKCTKKSDFHRTGEAESAFKQMKQLIVKLPTLTAPEEKEELIVYLAATKEAVSAVLMSEREAKQMEKISFGTGTRQQASEMILPGTPNYSDHGPTHKASPGKVKFLIVAIDYFTKWIEAKPVATITGNQVKKFVWDNIVCRFGLLGEIISDNRKQFRDNPFKDWCKKLCIRQRFASVKHPQANGLVERENRSLGEGIKARLDARNKNWMEEISHVLWAHRTMIKSSNGDTPFSLTYGTKVVIPIEIGMPTPRTAEVNMVQNDEALEINLDLLEERREHAAIREASKEKMEKYYNSKVRNTSFKPGELVYCSNDASHAEEVGKLGPKWEGPYEVTEVLGKGTYKLRDRDGKQLPRTWNVRNLKKCYVYEM
ncbi:reverse transcriptase domain-containing protein [Tanacetum coccineum]